MIKIISNLTNFLSFFLSFSSKIFNTIFNTIFVTYYFEANIFQIVDNKVMEVPYGRLGSIKNTIP